MAVGFEYAAPIAAHTSVRSFIVSFGHKAGCLDIEVWAFDAATAQRKGMEALAEMVREPSAWQLNDVKGEG